MQRRNIITDFITDNIKYGFNETNDIWGCCNPERNGIYVPMHHMNGIDFIFETKRFADITIDNNNKQINIDSKNFNNNISVIKKIDEYYSSTEFKNEFLKQLNGSSDNEGQLWIHDSEEEITIDVKKISECINSYKYENIFQNNKCVMDLSIDLNYVEGNVSTKIIKKSQGKKISFNEFVTHAPYNKINEYKISEARFIYELHGIKFCHSRKIYKSWIEITAIEYIDDL